MTRSTYRILDRSLRSTRVRINPPGRTDGRLSSGALRLSFWLRSIHLFPTSCNSVFHCPLCGVSSTGWGAHVQSHCPLVPGAAMYAFICVYNHLAEIGWHPVFSSCCSLTAVHPSSGPSTWRLLPDIAVHSSGAVIPRSFAIIWSVLLCSSGELTLPHPLRCHLTTTFLGAMDRWLLTHPTLRWDKMTRRCTTSSAPPATALLATILCYLLQPPPPLMSTAPRLLHLHLGPLRLSPRPARIASTSMPTSPHSTQLTPFRSASSPRDRSGLRPLFQAQC